MDRSVAKDDRQAAARAAPTFLTPFLIAQIDRALSKVGEFGEVRLVVMKGKLRFIQIMQSESVNESSQEQR
jgi:tellurite resistance-related uncharacterized protein